MRGDPDSRDSRRLSPEVGQKPSAPTVRAVIVTDGKRGHENQSRVVARMLGDLEPVVMHLRPGVRIGTPVEFLLRARLLLFGPKSFNRMEAGNLVRGLLMPEDAGAFRQLAEQVAAEKPRLFTISSGTPSATMNLIAARLLDAQPVVNMTPSLLPRRLFALNVLPEHDLHGQPAPLRSVASVLSLGYHDRAAAQFAAQQIRRDFGIAAEERLVAVCLGGPSGSARWESDHVHSEMQKLAEAAERHGYRLLVTTSRRTPPEFAAALREMLGRDLCPYFLDASESPVNPLGPFYELATVMAATGDSLSMVSEAVHGGHTTIVIPSHAGYRPGKHSRAVGNYHRAGMCIPLHTTDWNSILSSPPERKPVNVEYNRLEGEVREMLALL